MRVAFNDLARLAEQDHDLLEGAMRRVAASGRYILGPEVEAFEREWAAYCGAAHAVGVASGTDALKILLRIATEKRYGGRVITVANTAPPTLAAIDDVGLTPHFVDIDEEDGLMDPAKLPDPPPPETVAIVPVHLYGHMVTMRTIVEYAERHGLVVIEDACQAHGAVDANGNRPGELSFGAAFSFYPTKNLGCLGDGGAIVTNNHHVNHEARLMREYGYVDVFHIGEHVGYNSRLDEIQAAILRDRIPLMDQRNAARANATALYRARLTTIIGGGNHHIVAARVEDRRAVRARLADRGIDSAVHYPVPGYCQNGFSLALLRVLAGGHIDLRIVDQGECPVTDAWCLEILSLPMHPFITNAEVHAVCDALADAIKKVP